MTNILVTKNTKFAITLQAKTFSNNIFFIEKTNIMSYFMAAFKNFAKLATEKVNSNLRNIIIDQKTVLKNDSNIFD